MKINAEITILFSDDGLSIEITDSDAFVSFCELNLNQEQTCKALSRLGNCSVVKCDVRGLDRIGKILETDKLDFSLGDCSCTKLRETAIRLVHENCPEGWTPDCWFDSQDSIYIENGMYRARTTIRRWVEKEQTNVSDNPRS